MNLTIVLIAAYLPLLPLLFLILRSRSFGKGSRTIFIKLLFLGILAAVPAFLMEAGGLGAAAVIFHLFPEDAAGNGAVLFSVLLRYMLVGALIEEAWKHFILRISTWNQMTMETAGDGIAAAAVVGTAFSAVLYLGWQAAYHVLPADLDILRRAMPDFLGAGAVTAFIHALLFIPSHFGFAGLMGVLYGIAKGSEQKKHARRAGFMLFVSFLLAVLVHGVIESLIGYGFVTGQKLWLILGFAAEALLAFIMMSALVAVRDSSLEALSTQNETEAPVEFADSEEFADFAESEGNPDAGTGDSSQQILLEYGGADMETETGSPQSFLEYGGTDTETEAGSPQAFPGSGSSDTETGTDIQQGGPGYGSGDTEDLADIDGRDDPGDQDRPDDPETGTGFEDTAADPGEAGSADSTDSVDSVDSVDGLNSPDLSSGYGWTSDIQPAAAETPDDPSGDSGWKTDHTGDFS